MTILDTWTSIPRGEAAWRYASFIHRRTVDGMIIKEWSVDWANAPWTHAVYPQAEWYPLALPGSDSALFGPTAEATATTLGEALHVAVGIVSQRLSINLNDRHSVFADARYAKWGRTVASGGGRYCADAYLVESGGELPAGIYHYSTLHHGWERIATGDHTDSVALVQGYPVTAERYLLTTVNYWRSGFKYNDFAYQATAMDLGTLATCLLECLGPDLAGSWDVWTAESELTAMLGLDPNQDGVYAVQAFGESRAPEAPAAPPTEWPRRVDGSESTEAIQFLTTTALQRDMAEQPTRPEEFSPASSPISSVEFSARRRDWLGTLLDRESSFGRFTGESISAMALRRMLDHAHQTGGQFATGPGAQWEFLVYVNAVEGLAAGLYLYRDGELEQFSTEPQVDFLASTYFLQNYDGRRAAATVVLCGNVIEASRRWGVRGYRYINGVVGAMCQALALEGVSQGIGTGTALGFNTIEHARHAGLDAENMTPMLLMMTGLDDPLSGRFRSTTTTLEEIA